MTNEGREVKIKHDWSVHEPRAGEEDDEYVWVDPQNPVPRPEEGPLERRVSLPYEEALFLDEVDHEAMQYWFTEPKGGELRVAGHC